MSCPQNFENSEMRQENSQKITAIDEVGNATPPCGPSVRDQF